MRSSSSKLGRSSSRTMLQWRPMFNLFCHAPACAKILVLAVMASLFKARSPEMGTWSTREGGDGALIQPHPHYVTINNKK
eukprot:11610122-Ditylum_brightwellii.AAC.1